MEPRVRDSGSEDVLASGDVVTTAGSVADDVFPTTGAGWQGTSLGVGVEADSETNTESATGYGVAAAAAAHNGYESDEHENTGEGSW